MQNILQFKIILNLSITPRLKKNTHPKLCVCIHTAKQHFLHSEENQVSVKNLKYINRLNLQLFKHPCPSIALLTNGTTWQITDGFIYIPHSKQVTASFVCSNSQIGDLASKTVHELYDSFFNLKFCMLCLLRTKFTWTN